MVEAFLMGSNGMFVGISVGMPVGMLGALLN
jgi:hypothetical protein